MTVRVAVGAASLSLSLLAAPAAACPCSGVPGAGAVTTPESAWGLGVTARHATGLISFRADGSVSPFRDGEAVASSELGLALGHRPLEPLELQLATAAAHHQAELGGVRSGDTRWGDTRALARLDAVEAAPSGAAFPWPALALTAAGRFPTGGRPPPLVALGGLGAPLGTGEAALGVELAWQRREAWGGALIGEVAWRAPDDVLGVRRQLGPRLSLALLGEAPLSEEPELRLGLGVGLDHERPVDVGGRARPESATTLVSVSPGLRWFASDVVRAELGWRVTPPWAGWGRNAVAPSAWSASVVLTP